MIRGNVMKTYMMVLLTLFSFSSGIRYSAEDYTCENNTIRVKYKENWFDLNVFNVILHDDSDVCTYLEGTMEFEFEEAIINEEPYEAYIFLDHELLQKKLIEDAKADLKLNSPAYKYTMQVQTKPVIAEIETEDLAEKNQYSRKIAILLLCIWVLLCAFLLMRKLRNQKDINT